MGEKMIPESWLRTKIEELEDYIANEGGHEYPQGFGSALSMIEDALDEYPGHP